MMQHPERTPSSSPHSAAPVATGVDTAFTLLTHASDLRQQPIAEKLISATEERGALFAKLIILDPDSARARRIEQRLVTIDREVSTSFERLTALDRAHPAFENARIAYDTSVYETLRASFIRAGVDLGESQGRVIDTERLSRMQRTIKIMESRVQARFPSVHADVRSAPRELELDQSMSQLQCALRAATRLGEKIGIEHRIRAEADAAAIYRAISGWKDILPRSLAFLKPFAAVCQTLQNKSRAMIGYIDQAYQERSGRSLFNDLVQTYGKHSGARISRLMGGDQVTTAAYLLAQELKSWFISKSSKGNSARQIYEKIPVKEIPRFEECLARELKLSTSQIGDYVASRITSRDAQKLQALRDGDSLREKALDLSDILQRKASQRFEARSLLRDISPNALNDFAAAYRAEFGETLRHALSERIAPSAARDLCLALIDDDSKRVMAAQIKCALDYKEDWIGTPFLRKSTEERRALIESYNAVYHGDGDGDFWRDLRQSSWRDDYGILSHSPTLCRMLEKLWWPFTNSYPFIESIVRHGELKPHELLRYFMIGIGTDVRGIYAVLSNRSQSDISRISHDYEENYKPGPISRLMGRIPFVRDYLLLGNLRHDLKVELSGDHDFDISLYCEGLPNTTDERSICATMCDHLQRRYAHERGGLLLRNGFLNTIRGDGIVLANLERDYENAISFYQNEIEVNASLDPSTIRRFCTLTRLAEMQADVFREAKVSLGALVVNSGAFLGAALGAAATLLFTSFSLWTVAPASAAGSLLWRWVQGRLLLGNGFGRTDATFQMIRAFVDGASVFTLRAGITSLGALIGNKLTSGVAKTGFKTSLHRFIQTLEDRVGHQDKARHLIERGDLMASDEELNSLHQGFLHSLPENRAMLSGEPLHAPVKQFHDLYSERQVH